MNSGSLISISGGSGKYWISTRGDVATGLTFRLGEGNTDSTLTATANYYSSNIVCYINGTLGQLTGSSGSYTLPITVSCSDSSISPVTVRTTINYLYTDIVVTKYPSIHLNRVVAQKFSFATLIVTGGKAPYSFAMSPSTPLPTGMALDSSTGIISGQVTTANNISSSHTINMKTADGQTASCDFTIAITVEPSVTAITTSSTVQAYVGTFTTFTPVSGNNGLPPYVYSISPSVNSYYPGLTFDSTTGTISGTPISGSSTGNFRVTVTDRMNYAAAGDFVFKLSPAIFATTKISSKSMIVGIAETFTPVIGSGGKIPYAYSVSPSLPNGLSIDSATGTISGIPTITYNIGSTPFTITITDDNNATSSSSFRIGISAALAITSSITDQILFVGYTNIFTPVTASGGKAPYSYTISPALPTGLSMDSVTSTITATATSTLSNTSYTITATDSLGYTKTAPLQLKIYNRLSSKYSASNYTGSINKSLSVAAPTTTGGSGTGYTYSISPMLPATLIFNTSTGAISGTPTAGLTSTYYTISVKDSINLTTITAVFLGVLNITVGGFTGTSYIIRATTTTIGGSGNYTYLVIGNGGSGGPTAAVSSAGTISITRGSKSKATYTGSITVTDTTYNISVQVNFTYTI
jgi:hypothetical protein